MYLYVSVTLNASRGALWLVDFDMNEDIGRERNENVVSTRQRLLWCTRQRALEFDVTMSESRQESQPLLSA